MIRFSWKKIYRRTGLSAMRIKRAVKSMITKPKNIYDPIYPYHQKDFSGESYLLNPYELLNNAHHYSPKEVAEYVILASFRSFAEYSASNDATLDLFHSPLTEKQLKQNRLLSIENGRIHFVYEEATNRRKLHGN